MKKNILIFGSYGMSNVGDEEILKVFLREIRAKAKNIYVNSSDPKSTEKIFKVKCFSTSITKDVFKKIKYFFNSDIYIFGGGSVLIEHTRENLKWYHLSARPIYLSFFITFLGKILNKKVIFASIGVGPIKSKTAIILTKIILYLADEVIVRDSLSLELTKKITNKNVTLSSDVVLLNKITTKRKFKKLIIVFPSYHLPVNFKKKAWVTRNLVEIINRYSEKGWRVILVPLWYDFSFISDKWYSEKLIAEGAKAVISVHKNLESLMNKQLVKASLCISMRLHGAIFSTLAEKPFIALNYNPKVKGFVDKINSKYLVEIGDFESVKIINKLKTLAFNKLEKNNLLILKERAKLTFNIIDSYLHE